ncbi:MAG: hypothetical protein EGR89_04270 [[Eubacterium] rectale]|nr:hypothetical protein [Agathobacter rectalis]
MEDKNILDILKTDLQISVDSMDSYLLNIIQLSKDSIEKEGITLQENSVSDGMLVEMYAAYLYRQRKEDKPMPRYLRWNMNNRLLGQKAGK